MSRRWWKSSSNKFRDSGVGLPDRGSPETVPFPTLLLKIYKMLDTCEEQEAESLPATQVCQIARWSTRTLPPT